MEDNLDKIIDNFPRFLEHVEEKTKSSNQGDLGKYEKERLFSEWIFANNGKTHAHNKCFQFVASPPDAACGGAAEAGVTRIKIHGQKRVINVGKPRFHNQLSGSVSLASFEIVNISFSLSMNSQRASAISVS